MAAAACSTSSPFKSAIIVIRSTMKLNFKMKMKKKKQCSVHVLSRFCTFSFESETLPSWLSIIILGDLQLKHFDFKNIQLAQVLFLLSLRKNEIEKSLLETNVTWSATISTEQSQNALVPMKYTFSSQDSLGSSTISEQCAHWPKCTGNFNWKTIISFGRKSAAAMTMRRLRFVLFG